MGNLLDAVREEFTSRLQSQTNWGKNQVIALYTQVQLEVLSANTNNEEILGESMKFTVNKDHWYNIQKNKQESYYTPRGTQSYDTNESPDTDPFHDDKDINKGSL